MTIVFRTRVRSTALSTDGVRNDVFPSPVCGLDVALYGRRKSLEPKRPRNRQKYVADEDGDGDGDGGGGRQMAVKYVTLAPP